MPELSQTNVPRLFELMKSRKLTAKQVADAIGIPQSNFTEWKKGRSNPKYATLKALADYFNVPVDYLTGSESDENAIDLSIQAELQQLSDDKKADVLKYIKFVQQEG
ncbi:helix-turn-helix domain-containing protein [Treponema sp.]|uniref:helix-turn-helix domain-containing protein n=1 Tax=Treponema sp. TaxID=166 RepID=UPI00388FF680